MIGALGIGAFVTGAFATGWGVAEGFVAGVFSAGIPDGDVRRRRKTRMMPAMTTSIKGIRNLSSGDCWVAGVLGLLTATEVEGGGAGADRTWTIRLSVRFVWYLSVMGSNHASSMGGREYRPGMEAVKGMAMMVRPDCGVVVSVISQR